MVATLCVVRLQQNQLGNLKQKVKNYSVETISEMNALIHKRDKKL